MTHPLLVNRTALVKHLQADVGCLDATQGNSGVIDPEIKASESCDTLGHHVTDRIWYRNIGDMKLKVKSRLLVGDHLLGLLQSFLE